jgi:rhodanese-related sulfurtransferase
MAENGLNLASKFWRRLDLRDDGVNLPRMEKSGQENRLMVDVVTREELKKGMADGSITLLDVREPNEFAAGHIPGAISFPLSSFDPARLPNEPGKRVVFNCRSGQRTLRALDMARLGGRKDITAHYAGSMNDWVAAGEPVEV